MRLTKGESPKAKAIWMIVATVFLLLCVLGSYVIWAVRNGTLSNPLDIGNNTLNVKNVSFVDTNQEAYGQKRTETYPDYKITSYTGTKAGCEAFYYVANKPSGKTNKQIAMSVMESRYYSSKIKNQDELDKIKLKDENNQDEYEFESYHITQEVTAPAVGFKLRNIKLHFKDFGRDKVAAIGFACKDSVWEKSTQKLDYFVSKFVIKTER